MARPFRPISVARIASAVIVVLGAVALYWKVTGRQQLDKITLPNGFSIAIYSGAVPNARQMALGDNGTVFVGSMLEGNVYALMDGDGDNVAEETYTIASDLTLPSGVTFQDGALYVAALNRILVYDGIESRLANPPQPVVIRDDLPTLTHHGWKFIQFGPDGLLYLAVGMPCNICPESDGPYGAILRMRTDESDWEIFARGVRNSVGFDWDPQTGELWFTDNGRDMLGDDLPPDELNHAPTAGLHFGFPFCHGGTIADPDYGERPCSEFTPPAQPLDPHVASIGMRFYSGEMFPPEYHNQIFIAEHGSWNRSIPVGYRITVVRMEDNEAVGYDVFAEGWLQGRRPWGRPADVLVMPDGALLVSDDRQGAIYRISYGEK